MPLAILERYVLLHELRDSTERQYRRVCHVWRSWAVGHGNPQFDEDSVSQFLRDLQAAGRSSYYRKSTRSTLVALLRSAGMSGQVRAVRVEPLTVEAWDSEEVGQLVGAVRLTVRDLGRQRWWETLIEAAWLSGLNWADLRTVRVEDVPSDGWLRWRRSKTRKTVTVYLPRNLVEHRQAGFVWPWPLSDEAFRHQFARIVRQAGLSGSFKRLRKSTATAVEEIAPGRGHVYIGDERRTFERHYWRVDGAEKVHPPELVRWPKIA